MRNSTYGLPTIRSATTSVAPGTCLRICSISTASFSICLWSSPKIFTPIMARKPVWSMTMRVWIGWSHVGNTPGMSVFCRSSSSTSALVMGRSSGHTARSGALSHSGHWR